MGVRIDLSPRDGLDAYTFDRLRQLRADRVARAILAAENAPEREPFDLDTLAGVLARPAPARDRVEGLVPWEASTLVVAQRKTGKTTLTLNLARSLLTGEDFLGRFRTARTEGPVCLLNFEVSAAQVARWAADVDVPADRLILVNLRGRRNPLAAEDDRLELAGLLKARRVETLIVDPFGRAYAGASQNDAGEVGAWLASLDTFTRAEVGALDLVLTTHAGWNGERSRGSSALEDWADSIITLNRDENTGERFLRATGRDVDLDEDRLDYDPDTRRLTLAGSGSRTQTAQARRLDDLVAEVVRIIGQDPGLNGSRVGDRLKEAGIPHQKGDERKALRAATAAGRLVTAPGKGREILYYPAIPQQYPGGSCGDTPTPPIGVGGNNTHTRDSDTPNQPPCRICGQPLAPVHVADGFDTCPGCEVTP